MHNISKKALASTQIENICSSLASTVEDKNVKQFWSMNLPVGFKTFKTIDIKNSNQGL